MASTDGNFGYPVITNDDPMEGPEQITAAAGFWDTRVGESVATSADLPDATTKAGRAVTTLDTMWVYVSTGTEWKAVAGANLTGTITADTDYTLTGSSLEKDVHGWVDLSIFAVRNGGTLVSTETVGVIETGFRPTANLFRPVTATAAGGEAAQLFIGTDGTMKIYLSTAKTGFYGFARFKAA